MTTQSNEDTAADTANTAAAAAAAADAAHATATAADAAATANTEAAAATPAATDPAADAEASKAKEDCDAAAAPIRATPTALIFFPPSEAPTTDTAAASTLASMATDRDDQQNQFQVIQEVANPRDGVSPMVTQATSPPRNGIDAASPPDDSLLLLPLADYTSSDSVFCPFYYRLQAEIIKYGYHFSCTMAVLEVVQSILNLCNIGSTADRVIHIPFLPSMTFDPLLRTNFHLYQGENLKQKSKPTSGGGTVGGGGGGDDDDPNDGDDGNDNDDDDDDDDDDDQPEWEVNDKDVPQVGEAYPSPDIMDQDIEDNYESYKAVVQATQHQKETYTKLTLALKSVSLLCHVYEKYIPLVRNHHLKLRQEAMTIESVITAHGRGEMTDVQVSTITPLVAPSFVCLYGSLNSHSFS